MAKARRKSADDSAREARWQLQQERLRDAAYDVYVEIFPWFRAEYYRAIETSDEKEIFAVFKRAGDEWRRLTGCRHRLTECYARGWPEALPLAGANPYEVARVLPDARDIEAVTNWARTKLQANSEHAFRNPVAILADESLTLAANCQDGTIKGVTENTARVEQAAGKGKSEMPDEKPKVDAAKGGRPVTFLKLRELIAAPNGKTAEEIHADYQKRFANRGGNPRATLKQVKNLCRKHRK